MRITALAVLSAIVVLTALGCARPQGETAHQKREFVEKMRRETLAELFVIEPESKILIQQSPGYAVFSNYDTYFLFIGQENGYGVAVNNKTGEKTYMKMQQIEGGLGFAFKDIREIIIFLEDKAFRDFIKSGWDFGVKGDVGVTTQLGGKEVKASRSFYSDMVIYRITKTGAALRASFGGSKYWRYDELNR